MSLAVGWRLRLVGSVAFEGVAHRWSWLHGICAASGVCGLLQPSAFSGIGVMLLCVGSGAVLPFAESSHRWAWLHMSLCGGGPLAWAARKDQAAACWHNSCPQTKTCLQLHDAGRDTESWLFQGTLNHDFIPHCRRALAACALASSNLPGPLNGMCLGLHGTGTQQAAPPGCSECCLTPLLTAAELWQRRRPATLRAPPCRAPQSTLGEASRATRSHWRPPWAAPAFPQQAVEGRTCSRHLAR